MLIKVAAPVTLKRNLGLPKYQCFLFLKSETTLKIDDSLVSGSVFVRICLRCVCLPEALP